MKVPRREAGLLLLTAVVLLVAHAVRSERPMEAPPGAAQAPSGLRGPGDSGGDLTGPREELGPFADPSEHAMRSLPTGPRTVQAGEVSGSNHQPRSEGVDVVVHVHLATTFLVPQVLSCTLTEESGRTRPARAQRQRAGSAYTCSFPDTPIGPHQLSVQGLSMRPHPIEVRPGHEHHDVHLGDLAETLLHFTCDGEARDPGQVPWVAIHDGSSCPGTVLSEVGAVFLSPPGEVTLQVGGGRQRWARHTLLVERGLQEHGIELVHDPAQRVELRFSLSGEPLLLTREEAGRLQILDPAGAALPLQLAWIPGPAPEPDLGATRQERERALFQRLAEGRVLGVSLRLDPGSEVTLVPPQLTRDGEPLECAPLTHRVGSVEGEVLVARYSPSNDQR